MADAAAYHPTERFSARAGVYDAQRPGYPAALLEELARWVAPAGAPVADLGAGTGILTEAMLQRGWPVLAVEPNAAMRGELAALQQPYPALQCQAAPAEATGLPAGTCQGVTAAQALHWFDRAALRQELLRVLAPGGWLAVIWNERQRAPGFPRRYDDTLLAHCPAYRRLPLGFRLSPWAQAQLYGQAVARYEFPHEQHHDWPGLQQRIASCSYVPPDGTEAHAALMRDMAQLFAAYAQDGRVTLPYIARLYIGRVVEAGP